MKAYKPIVESIAQTFGNQCEVVLHDLRYPKKSVVMVVNGHVTGRKVGQPFRDLLKVLRSKEYNNDHLSNYYYRTDDGKILKCSTALIRDENCEVIGALCINYDIGKFLISKKIIDEFCETFTMENSTDINDDNVILSEDVNNILKKILDRVIQGTEIPVANMSKEKKLEIVSFLDDKGVFQIKGAVDELAKNLNVSRYSIYNYLEEARSKKK